MPAPQHLSVPGQDSSLHLVAFLPLQTYVPPQPHATPSVPPVMAPHPPHALNPGSVPQVTELSLPTVHA